MAANVIAGWSGSWQASKQDSDYRTSLHARARAYSDRNLASDLDDLVPR
jgi:hypothetical protein